MIMDINKKLLISLEGKTEDEKKELLLELFNFDLDKLRKIDSSAPCKTWYAQVFSYCSTDELQAKLDIFFKLVSMLGYWCNICFQHEDTVFLGCICPCGTKQTILYYSLA